MCRMRRIEMCGIITGVDERVIESMGYDRIGKKVMWESVWVVA